MAQKKRHDQNSQRRPKSPHGVSLAPLTFEGAVEGLLASSPTRAASTPEKKAAKGVSKKADYKLDRRMKVFWNDCGRGVEPDLAKEVDLKEAGLIWSDEVRGIEGNFLGLIDDQDNTIQFYFDAGIPDHIDDASDLEVVFMDFPQPDKNGSFAKHVTIGDVHGLIEKVFKVGADHRKFDGLSFVPW